MVSKLGPFSEKIDHCNSIWLFIAGDLDPLTVIELLKINILL